MYSLTLNGLTYVNLKEKKKDVSKKKKNQINIKTNISNLA